MKKKEKEALLNYLKLISYFLSFNNFTNTLCFLALVSIFFVYIVKNYALPYGLALIINIGAWCLGLLGILSFIVFQLSNKKIKKICGK